VVDYASEEEQVEAIRRWWKENGTSVIAGALIGILALAGWRGWVWYRDSQALGASGVYEQLTQQVEAGKHALVMAHAETLRDTYAGTTYAVLGALAAAGTAVDDGDLETAATWLSWAKDNADSGHLAALARVRLARIAAERGQPERALTLLDADHPGAFAGLVGEIRGDVLAQQGKAEAAVQAYQTALDAETPPPDPRLVRRKLNQVQSTGASSSESNEAKAS
jgi:predicted negative regulator of RcsB-dependent stress response